MPNSTILYLARNLPYVCAWNHMIRGILNYHVAVINNINSYTKSVCLLSTELMPYVGISKKTNKPKNRTRSKNSNTKLTLGFLYGLLCTKWSLYEIRYHLVQKSLFEVTPMLLYEMVSLVRSGLCSKWSLYEVTWPPY